MNRLRAGSPRFIQNCTAIFMATSTATEPESQKNEWFRLPGISAARRSASRTACG